jgi:predicted component of viral defense system (DUF524 family)
MQPIKIPELPILRGAQAINALHEYIKELEEQENEELTEKQKKALIKLAQELVSTIETETHSANADKKNKSLGFATQLKKTISRLF